MMKNINKYKRGMALYLIIVMVAVLLPLALGLSVIIINQIKMTREMGYSVVALYAADAGTERALLGWRTDPGNLEIIHPECNNPGNLCDISNASYYVLVYEGENMPGGPDLGGHCDGPDLYYCIKAVGIYQGVSRSIEVNF